MKAEAPGVSGPPDLVAREKLERRPAMPQACLLPLRQLIHARGRQGQACCCGHQHTDTNRPHRRSRYSHPGGIGNGAERHPDREIARKQKHLRSRGCAASVDAALNQDAGAAAPRASLTGASSPPSSPPTSRGTSSRARVATDDPCSSTPSTSTIRRASASPAPCPALETVDVHAAIVAIAAMTSEVRTLLSCCRFGLTDGLIENFDEVHDAHGAAGGLQARGDLQQAAGIA